MGLAQYAVIEDKEEQSESNTETKIHEPGYM